MNPFRIEVRDEQGVRVIKCGGQIDYDTYRNLKKEIDEAMCRSSYNIVVDLKDVTYVSTAGWGVVLGNINKAREHGGDIKLAGMSRNVKKSFDLLELGSFVFDYGDTGQAVKIFRAH